jgi:hypothetical protein
MKNIICSVIGHKYDGKSSEHVRLTSTLAMAEFFANRSTNMSTQVLIAHEKLGRNPGISPIPEVMQERAKNMLMKKHNIDKLHYCTEECGKYFITREMMRVHDHLLWRNRLPEEE